MELNYVKEVIESNYNIKISSAEKIKSVYKIKSGNMDYCLKVIKYELAHFLFILGVIRYLQENCFEKIPEIISTSDGKDFIIFDRFHAYLTPWVNARECNYDNLVDLEIAAKKLADLHNKSQGFHITENMKPRIGWFKWIETFNTRRDEIVDFRKRIELKEEKSEFDNLYLSVIEEELERAEKSIINLTLSNYMETMESEIENKGFCHHDYAHHNVLIEDNGDVNIIDFDYCILDSHLHDLCSLLIRTMKNGKWDMNTALYLMNQYNSIKKIQNTDVPIMAAFMEFPQDYWQVGIQYYWEQQCWGEDFFVKKLQKICEDREEKQEFIEEFRTHKYNGGVYYE